MHGKLSEISQVGEGVSLEFRRCIGVIQQIMTTNNNQSYQKNDGHWKINQESQYNHANPNCPDHLQNKKMVQRIESPSKSNDEQFNKYQPESARNEKCA